MLTEASRLYFLFIQTPNETRNK